MNNSRHTQRGKVLELLQSRAGQWVSLPEILGLGFAQFGARILELRRAGNTILNKTEHRDGKVLSWYRLEARPKSDTAAPAKSESLAPHDRGLLFDPGERDRSYAE